MRALILTPTRRLAAQGVAKARITVNISIFARGGIWRRSINPRVKLRGGVDVLVATPGRLLDTEHQNAVKLDR